MKRSPCRHQSKRRKPSHQCHGQCGTAGCSKIYCCADGLRNHISTKKFRCPIDGCDATLSKKNNMYAHVRTMHSSILADDGSCVEHGIPPIRSKKIRLPDDYQGRVDQGAYRWIVKAVVRHAQHDHTNKNFTACERAYAGNLMKNNVAYHAIAQDIVNVLIERGLFGDMATDDAGGRLPNGFVLREHGGVFSLSLDRKDNNRPHFLKEKQATANVNLVARGMNNRASIVGKFGARTCEVLRAKVSYQHSKEEVERVLNSAEAAAKDHNNFIYQSCMGVYVREKRLLEKYQKKPEDFTTYAVAAMTKFSHDFPTSSSLVRHVFVLWREQMAKCAISSILMDTGIDALSCFKPSLDAILPRKHHVKGHLRIICHFLNSINSDKVKKYDHKDDPESMWTTESFLKYIGESANS